MTPQDRLTLALLRATSDPWALGVADEDERRGIPAYTADEERADDPRAWVLRCPVCGERSWVRGCRRIGTGPIYCGTNCRANAYQARRRAKRQQERAA